MDIIQVSTHLTLLPQLSRKEVYDLLFNLGYHHKQFKQLLAFTHSPSIQKKLLELKPNVKLQEATSPLHSRLSRLLDGYNISLNTYEYHVLYTLVDSPYITKATRESLRVALEYIPYAPAGSDKQASPCVVCGHPTSNGFCLSCIRKIHEYTEYRRESFRVPVNYINFNIRNYVNTTGYHQITYMDWLITKRASEVEFVLLNTLPDGVGMIQYPLPFVDYQKEYLSGV